MRTKPLTADDLQVGMTVTVLESRPKLVTQSIGQGDDESGRPVSTLAGIAAMMPCLYAMLKGHPLRIDAVDLPYIVATCRHCNQTLHIDTRDCELSKVTEEYARALEPKRGKWWRFGR